MGRMLFVAAYAAAVALLAALCKLKSLLRLGLFFEGFILIFIKRFSKIPFST